MGLSNSEEKAKRTKNRLLISLIVSQFVGALENEDKSTIIALKNVYPNLTKVFAQLEETTLYER